MQSLTGCALCHCAPLQTRGNLAERENKFPYVSPPLEILAPSRSSQFEGFFLVLDRAPFVARPRVIYSDDSVLRKNG